MFKVSLHAYYILPDALCCPGANLQVLFTTEVNRRLAAADIPVDAVCLHPGNVMTEVVRTLPPLVQKLYRALLTHILFTPQEGTPQHQVAGKGLRLGHQACLVVDAHAARLC